MLQGCRVCRFTLHEVAPTCPHIGTHQKHPLMGQNTAIDLHNSLPTRQQCGRAAAVLILVAAQIKNAKHRSFTEQCFRPRERWISNALFRRNRRSRTASATQKHWAIARGFFSEKEKKRILIGESERYSYIDRELSYIWEARRPSLSTSSDRSDLCPSRSPAVWVIANRRSVHVLSHSVVSLVIFIRSVEGYDILDRDNIEPNAP